MSEVKRLSLGLTQERLVDAYLLLDFSEKLLDDVTNAPFPDLPRILSLLRKNIRDAKALLQEVGA